MPIDILQVRPNFEIQCIHPESQMIEVIPATLSEYNALEIDANHK